MESIEGQSDDGIDECCIKEKGADENGSFDEIYKDNEVVREESIIPKLGMIFDSRDNAFLLYKAYGYHTGFGVVRRSKHDFYGRPYSAKFTCSKGGKPRVQSSSCRTRLKPISKTECPAMMFVKDQHFQDLWQVEALELQHNHQLIPDMVRFTKCFRELPVSVQKQLEINDTAGSPLNKSIGAVITQGGGYEKCSFSEKDCRNHIDKKRRLSLGKGDAEALKEYFYNMQAQNPNFYHSMDVDEEGRLRNVFWADARSRLAHQYFGDVISFDTTYLTNKYAMPFASFVGVNHHGQSVLLGCGLLADETTETYIWLFKRWLTCMNDKPPNAIITDQCKAIRGGVEAVFPHARHRFCLWHIMKKFPEKIGRYKEREAISFRLSKAIYESLAIVEFENNWSTIIEKYKLGDNDWLASLFEDRERWVPVFVKDTFWAGMSTTQRSESKDAFFDGYVTSRTSLKQFVEQYENALRSKYEKEAHEDFRSLHTRPQLISPFKWEEQVAKVYTISIFMKFQDEVKQMIQLNTLKIGKDGPIVTYQVTELAEDKHVDYRVVYNIADQDVWCICRSFQFRGILCRHALCVLRQELVREIPSKYILDRWRKDFKRLHASISLTHVAPMYEMKLFDELYVRGQQYLADIVEVGAQNYETKEFALAALKEARDKVIKFDELHADKRIVENLLPNTAPSNFMIDTNEDLENGTSVIPSVGNISSPAKAHLKDRPSKSEKAINNKKKSASSKEKNTTTDKGQNTTNKIKKACTNVHPSQFGDSYSLTQIGTQENFGGTVQSFTTNLSLSSQVGYFEEQQSEPHLQWGSWDT